MWNETIEIGGHTTKRGTLNRTVKVGTADADVEITVQVRAITPSEHVDANGWLWISSNELLAQCLNRNVGLKGGV